MKELLRIKKVIRQNNSIYGNPRWYIEAYNEKGELIKGKTENNGRIGYLISGWDEEHFKVMEYHITKKGNVIFTDIEKQKKPLQEEMMNCKHECEECNKKWYCITYAKENKII